MLGEQKGQGWIGWIWVGFALPVLNSTFGPFSASNRTLGPWLIEALANCWSRQHVLLHACGLSALLFSPVAD